MSATVVVPFVDYFVPVPPIHNRAAITPTSGYLLINETDYLLITATDKLIIRPSTLYSPTTQADYPDYTIPVPKPGWA